MYQKESSCLKLLFSQNFLETGFLALLNDLSQLDTDPPMNYMLEKHADLQHKYCYTVNKVNMDKWWVMAIAIMPITGFTCVV